eukprot:13325738-Alexandrium_andersonii.AAC.1
MGAWVRGCVRARVRPERPTWDIRTGGSPPGKEWRGPRAERVASPGGLIIGPRTTRTGASGAPEAR